LQFSLIVPCFNNLPVTQQFLRSLLAWGPLGYDTELIFVDDASTDDTPQWLFSLSSPYVKVVSQPTNTGFAGAMNSGAALARGKFVVLLNNDLVLMKGWFDPFHDTARNWRSDFGVFGNVQLRVDDNTVDHAGIELTQAGRFQHVKCLPESLEPMECPLMTGACMMLLREDFLKHGGFDTAYLNGVEDLELCFQLLAAGKKNHVLPASIVGHHVSASRRTANQESRDVKNLVRLYSRWQDQLVKMHQSLYPDLNSNQVISQELNHLQLLLEHKV
jgi:O-antigen biosynthesis protein